MFNRDDLMKDLSEGVLEVVFDKVDGSQRTLRCTLRPDLLPKIFNGEKEEFSSFHKENPEVIAVWGIHENNWRSFRVENVRYVQSVEGY